MRTRPQEYYEARAAALKALAHPTRLRFVDMLRGGERCVCELTAEAGADQSTVSKHLAVLKRAGLVTDERRGTMVFYRLRRNVLRGVIATLEAIGAPEPASGRGSCHTRNSGSGTKDAREVAGS